MYFSRILICIIHVPMCYTFFLNHSPCIAISLYRMCIIRFISIMLSFAILSRTQKAEVFKWYVSNNMHKISKFANYVIGCSSDMAVHLAAMQLEQFSCLFEILVFVGASPVFLMPDKVSVFYSSGPLENLLLQSPMQHSHVIANWCMPAFKMDLYAYFLLQFSN